MSIYDHILVNPRNEEANATLRHFYTSNNFGSEGLELCLMDGGSYSITASELYTALQIFASDYFADMVEAHNKAEQYSETTEAAYIKAKNGDEDAIYDVYHGAKLIGRYRERAQQMKERIQERVSWDSWIAACRLYETLYQIPREWL